MRRRRDTCQRRHGAIRLCSPPAPAVHRSPQCIDPPPPTHSWQGQLGRPPPEDGAAARRPTTTAAAAAAPISCTQQRATIESAQENGDRENSVRTPTARKNAGSDGRDRRRCADRQTDRQTDMAHMSAAADRRADGPPARPSAAQPSSPWSEPEPWPRPEPEPEP